MVLVNPVDGSMNHNILISSAIAINDHVLCLCPGVDLQSMSLIKTMSVMLIHCEHFALIT